MLAAAVSGSFFGSQVRSNGVLKKRSHHGLDEKVKRETFGGRL
jgi:hypothetical protein